METSKLNREGVGVDVGAKMFTFLSNDFRGSASCDPEVNKRIERSYRFIGLMCVTDAVCICTEDKGLQVADSPHLVVLM